MSFRMIRCVIPLSTTDPCGHLSGPLHRCHVAGAFRCACFAALAQLGPERQADGERGALACLAFHGHRAVVRLDDGSHETETENEATFAAAAIPPEQALPYPGQVVGR